jgi:hypothetical protein
MYVAGFDSWQISASVVYHSHVLDADGQEVIAFVLLCLVSAIRGAGGPQALSMFQPL